MYAGGNSWWAEAMHNRDYLTITLTLQDSHRPFVRSLDVATDLAGEEISNLICLALGRYPTPDALLKLDGTYHGNPVHHFAHPDLSDECWAGPLPPRILEAELILGRLDGWVFRLSFAASSHWEGTEDAYLRDTAPLLPGHRIRLPEFNAVQRVRANDPLPPDLERSIIVEALLDHMDPDLEDVELAIKLYSTLRRTGRVHELSGLLHVVSISPDVEVLHELLTLSVSDNPPRITKSGHLYLPVVRGLIRKFPVLKPTVTSRRGWGYGDTCHSAGDAVLLNDIVEVGRRVGVFTAEPRGAVEPTDLGRDVLAGEPGVLNDLRQMILEARLTLPQNRIQQAPDHRHHLTFEQFLSRQEPPVDYYRRYEYPDYEADYEPARKPTVTYLPSREDCAPF